MKYNEALQAINPVKALKVLFFDNTELSGKYVNFQCIKCGQPAIMKAYGEKKNLWYCPNCKGSGHVISLGIEVMNARNGETWDYERVKKHLMEKASGAAKRLTEELKLNYELEYDKFLENYHIEEAICKDLGIGKPKGQKMLAGCIAFTIRNERGTKVAYYGIRKKDLKPVFYKTFNPEHFLYNLDRVGDDKEVTLTREMLECVNMLQIGSDVVSNFGLPYLSREQIIFLKRFEYINFVNPTQEMIQQAVNELDCWLKISKSA